PPAAVLGADGLEPPSERVYADAVELIPESAVKLGAVPDLEQTPRLQLVDLSRDGVGERKLGPAECDPNGHAHRWIEGRVAAGCELEGHSSSNRRHIVIL